MSNNVECPEFRTTWVRSGQFLSDGPMPVPATVRDAPARPGVHQTYLAPGTTATPALAGALAGQPLAVVSRLLHRPGAAPADLAAAKDLANRLGHPVQVPASLFRDADLPAMSVLPFDAQGGPADLAGADHGYVLPDEHLADRHPDTTGGGSTDHLGQDLRRDTGPAMTGQVRLVDDEHLRIGLPAAVVDARYGGLTAEPSPTGAAQSLNGGGLGLWRHLEGLRPGAAVLLEVVPQAGAPATRYLAVRDTDGLAVMRPAADGARAADLPRDPVSVVSTPVQMDAWTTTVAEMPFAGAVAFPRTYVRSAESGTHTPAQAHASVTAARNRFRSSAESLEALLGGATARPTRSLAGLREKLEQLIQLDKWAHTQPPRKDSKDYATYTRERDREGAIRSGTLAGLRDLSHRLAHGSDVLGVDPAALRRAVDDMLAAVSSLDDAERVWRRVGRDLARDVIAEVHRRLPYGASNQVATGIRYDGAALRLLGEHVRNDRYAREPSGPLEFAAQSAWLAQYFGTGNCGEHAYVTLAVLLARPDTAGVEISVVTHEIDHMFVVVGPLGHPQSLVIDPWPPHASSTMVRNFFLDDLAHQKVRRFRTPRPVNLLELGARFVNQSALVPPPTLVPVTAPHGTYRDSEHGYWDNPETVRDGGDRNSDSGASTGSREPVDVPSIRNPRLPEHEAAPAEYVQRPPGAPGLILLDRDQTSQLAAARSYRGPANEYPVFMHGSVQGGVVGGKVVTPEQLRDLIVADPASAGKTIVLIACDVGVTPKGATVRQDYAARLFSVLPPSYPRVLAPSGTAYLPPAGTTGGPTVMRVSSSLLGPDGRYRLAYGGVRSYEDAEQTPPVAGARTPMVRQYGPTLHHARTGPFIPLTDNRGGAMPQILHDARRRVESLGGTSPVTPTGVAFPTLRSGQGYRPLPDALSGPALTAYNDVVRARAEMATAAAGLRRLAATVQGSTSMTEISRWADQWQRADRNLRNAPAGTNAAQWARLVDDEAGTRAGLLGAIDRALTSPRVRNTLHLRDGLRQLHPAVHGLEAAESAWRRRGREVAREIIARVHERMRYGPANQEVTVLRYGQPIVDAVRTMRRFSAAPPPGVNRHAWTAILAEHFGTGCCDEYAAMSFALLMSDPGLRGMPIHLVAHTNPSHVFVVLGSLEHPHSVVVDPWPLQARATTVANFHWYGLRHYRRLEGSISTQIDGIDHLTPARRQLDRQRGLPSRPDLTEASRSQTRVVNRPDLSGNLWHHENTLARGASPNSDSDRSDTSHTAQWYITNRNYPHRGYRDRYGTGGSGATLPAAADTRTPHPAPAKAAEYLPGTPGLMLLDADQHAQRAAATSFRGAPDEYVVVVHGTVDGPVVNGHLLSPGQLRDLIVADPRSAGKKIVLAACDLAVTPDGGTLTDDWAAKLFAELPRANGNRSVLAMGGTATLFPPSHPDATSDLRVATTTLGQDGRFRLASGGIREYRDAPAGPGDGDRRTPMVLQHGPSITHARLGTGVPLTDRTGRSLTEPPATSGRPAGPEPRPAPVWPLRLTGPMAQPFDDLATLHVVSSGPADPTLVRDAGQLARRRPGQHIVVLGAAKPGRPPADADVSALNLLLEQLAQREIVPVVVTAGWSTGLAAVLGRYGAPVLRRTPKAAAGGLQLNADNGWAASASRSAGSRRLAPPEVHAGLTLAALDAATALARPTEAVRQVDDTLGALVWAPTVQAARAALPKAAQGFPTRDYLTQVTAMIERVPGEPRLAIVKPLLEFHAIGHAEVVSDFATAAPGERPKVLLDAVGRLETAGDLDGVVTTQFVSLVQAADSPPQAREVAVSVLTAIGLIRARQWQDAGTFIEQNRGRLSPEEKLAWVDAVAGLITVMPGEQQQLASLSAGILNC